MGRNRFHTSIQIIDYIPTNEERRLLSKKYNKKYWMALGMLYGEVYSKEHDRSQQSLFDWFAILANGLFGFMDNPFEEKKWVSNGGKGLFCFKRFLRGQSSEGIFGFCRGQYYRVNYEYIYPNRLFLGKSGFHCCFNEEDLNKFYPNSPSYITGLVFIPDGTTIKKSKHMLSASRMALVKFFT